MAPLLINQAKNVQCSEYGRAPVPPVNAIKSLIDQVSLTRTVESSLMIGISKPLLFLLKASAWFKAVASLTRVR